MPADKKPKAEHFQPAFPHVPFQDQFNQTHFIFGVSKKEYLSAIIAPGVITAFPNALPEVVASLSMDIASHILSECAKELEDLQNSEQPPKVISMKK